MISEPSIIGPKPLKTQTVWALTQLEGVCDLGSLKKTKLFPTNTTQDGLQFFLQNKKHTYIPVTGDAEHQVILALIYSNTFHTMQSNLYVNSLLVSHLSFRPPSAIFVLFKRPAFSNSCKHIKSALKSAIFKR